jgi:hypothetical protein
VTYGHVEKSLFVVRRRTTESSSYDHPVAVAKLAVTWRAVDVVALATPNKNFAGDWEGDRIGYFSIEPSIVEVDVLSKRPACNCAVYMRTSGTAVLEEIAGFESLEPRLIVHILTTAKSQENGDCTERCSPP